MNRRISERYHCYLPGRIEPSGLAGSLAHPNLMAGMGVPVLDLGAARRVLLEPSDDEVSVWQTP